VQLDAPSRKTGLRLCSRGQWDAHSRIGLIRTVQTEIGPDYTVLTGKQIVEIKPSGKDKGQAVSELMAEEPFKGRVPVFIGDDTTDEF
jgi:trehalose 6-phosphate phosphatase